MANLCNSLLACPAIFGAMLIVGATALAGENPAAESPSVLETSSDNVGTDTSNAIEQVTSVSQLSDVQPTDWAFQALQSLVERYGCIAGYPDSTYRGNRALTRYEFAAGLNACLDRVNELIASATSDLVRKEDLATLQRLQEEFAKELAALRGHVDALEANTAQLQANQFSATTKLNAEVVVAVAGIVTGQNASGRDIDKVNTFGTRTRLNFESSFTGKDLLRTRLQVVNLNSFSSSSTLTPEGDLRFTAGTFQTGSNNVGLDQLLYSFPLGKNTTIAIDANAGANDDFADTVNPYLDGDGGSGALSEFGTRNPIGYLIAGTGIGLRHQFNNNLELSLGYLATAAYSPTGGNGLFNGPYGALAQLTIKPSDRFTLGLTFVHSYNIDLTSGSNRANLRSALLSDSGALPSSVLGGGSTNQGSTQPAGDASLPTGVLQALRGQSLPTSSNSYGIEASWKISPKFVINGWVGFTKTRTLSTLGGAIPRGDLDILNYAVTLAFPDLGKEGNLAGIIVGMEPKVTGVSRSLRDQIGKDPNTSLHIEGFYQYQLTDNITITPGIIWLTAPDHNSANDDIVIGAIRTTFTF